MPYRGGGLCAGTRRGEAAPGRPTPARWCAPGGCRRRLPADGAGAALDARSKAFAELRAAPAAEAEQRWERYSELRKAAVVKLRASCIARIESVMRRVTMLKANPGEWSGVEYDFNKDTKHKAETYSS